MAPTTDNHQELPKTSTSIANGLRPVRPRKPNYHKLHELPLPLKTYPLPTIVLHNPLSIIGAALWYLSEIISRPLGVVSSHQQIPYKAYFSSETRSVHVTDPATVRALWEKGFFGKGTLSRSEPSWLAREQAKRNAAAGNTSEEATLRRREERRQFKNERALKEREAIEQQLKEEGKLKPKDNEILVSNPYVNALSNGHIDSRHENDMNGAAETPNGIKAVRFSPTVEHISPPLDVHAPKAGYNHSKQDPAEELEAIENQEHLQLTLEEAFFLAYGLGVLTIHDPTTMTIMPTNVMLSTFVGHSYFPPRADQLLPDDRFLISYVVYHHFRSLGWVVRPGVKFAVDYLLYQRGPVFTHAEFGVIILPSYTHPYWRADPDREKQAAKKEYKAWWWLHGVNRVQSQVRKTLILVYVDVPPPENGDGTRFTDGKGGVMDVAELLKRYKVREVGLKRWIPNRSRD